MVEGFDSLGPYYLRRLANTDPLAIGNGYWLYNNGVAPVTWTVP
jgi:hypothetical protein